KEKLGQVVS
ncbi:unnamed protein product, partial [Callosobruchus maculatus]